LGYFGVDEKNTIKMDLKETECGRVNYIHKYNSLTSAARIHEQDNELINSLKWKKIPWPTDRARKRFFFT